MALQEELAEIGDGAHLPEQGHRLGAPGAGAHGGIEGEARERRGVLGGLHPPEAAEPGPLVERGEEGLDRAEVEVGVAPGEAAHGGEAVGLDGGGDPLGEAEGRDRAEGAVPEVAPGAAGDLRQLGRLQLPLDAAVELAQPGEGYVPDVEVEAHADGVGRHQRVDLARLEERHLRVAGARRERAEHHRGPAPQRPQPLGERVDLGDGERHHGAPRRQARELHHARAAEAREPGAVGVDRGGQELAHQRAHGVRAEEPRLLPPACSQDPVGEDVPPLGVRGELDLVDRDEVDLAIDGHRLHGAHPVVRPARDPLLLAGDQRHPGLAEARGEPIVDLAGEEAQRQTDHPRGVLEHALDRPVGLAGVGGPQEGRDGRAFRHGRDSCLAETRPLRMRQRRIRPAQGPREATSRWFRRGSPLPTGPAIA